MHRNSIIFTRIAGVFASILTLMACGEPYMKPLCPSDDMVASEDSGQEQPQSYIECATDADCPTGVCAELSNTPMWVCVVDDAPGQEYVTCSSDADCGGGICAVIKDAPKWGVCTEPRESDGDTIDEPFVCPFVEMGGRRYQGYDSMGLETPILATEYLPESCELLMYAEEEPTHPAWHYVLYVESNGSINGVVAYGATVEIIHLSVGWIDWYERKVYDPEYISGAYTIYLLPEHDGE